MEGAESVMLEFDERSLEESQLKKSLSNKFEKLRENSIPLSKFR